MIWTLRDGTLSQMLSQLVHRAAPPRSLTSRGQGTAKGGRHSMEQQAKKTDLG